MAWRPSEGVWTLNGFTGLRLDRDARLRRNEAQLARLLAGPDTRILPMWGSLHWVGTSEPWRLALCAPEVQGLLEAADCPVYLGRAKEVPLFAASVKDEGLVARLAQQGNWCELRQVAAVLPADQAALLAYARALVLWHQASRFCGRCGRPTASAEGGHARRCTGCDQALFPRIDPAVIGLVHGPQRCLLGRHRAWPKGMYSALAGFVEPGEALEQALAREVEEETGVQVLECRYHSSQPWPFPASLMVGFLARALETPLAVDPQELEEARWFSRDELAAGLRAGALQLPPPVSIAFRLVEDWFDQEANSPLSAVVSHQEAKP
ncbi:NAD(+) diphosphatase [Pelomicrobium sp.]|uniref:NAD(+) diphosphatase n=1 Tax=Pelomicrobium sp. TaxID=2815319 RepID=UPI002FDDC9EF